MQNMKVIYFPSADGDAYGMAAVIPSTLSNEEAIAVANRVIAEVNLEDLENDGACNDGNSVQENIMRHLREHGFVFPEVLRTRAWDAGYDTEDVIVAKAAEAFARSR